MPILPHQYQSGITLKPSAIVAGMTRKKKEPVVSMTLRYPKGVKERLSQIADHERRSLNEQIVYALERWLEQQVVRNH